MKQSSNFQHLISFNKQISNKKAFLFYFGQLIIFVFVTTKKYTQTFCDYSTQSSNYGISVQKRSRCGFPDAEPETVLQKTVNFA